MQYEAYIYEKCTESRLKQFELDVSPTESNKLGAWPWLICLVGALFYGYEYYLRITPSVMTSQLMQHFQIHAALFGGLNAIYYYAYVPMQLPVGVLMDRYGPRRLLTLACASCVIGTYLFASSHSLVIAGIGRFLIGFGSAFAFIGVLKLATMWLPANKLAFAVGMTAAIGTVAAIVGDISLTSLMHRIGWHETLILSVGFGSILIFVLWFFVKDKPTSSQVPLGDIKLAYADLKAICHNPQIWINGMFGCLVYLPTTVLGELWGIRYLSQAHHFSPHVAALGISLLFIGFTVGAPFIGWMSDRLEQRCLPMFIGAVGAAMAATLLIYYPHLSHTEINLLLLVLGFSYSCQSLVFAVAREISPLDAAGTAMAATNMIVMLGGMLAQPLVGILLEWHNRYYMFADRYVNSDYHFALAIIPLGIITAGILTFFLKETHANMVECDSVVALHP